MTVRALILLSTSIVTDYEPTGARLSSALGSQPEMASSFARSRPRSCLTGRGNIAASPRSAPASPLRELLQWGNPMSPAPNFHVTDI